MRVTSRLSLMTFVALFAPFVRGQDADNVLLDWGEVPTAVRETVERQWGQVDGSVQWRKRGEMAVYEVDVERDGKRAELIVYPNGSLLQGFREISPERLPAAVMKAVRSRLGAIPGDSHVTQFVLAGGFDHYNFRLQTDDGPCSFWIAADGRFLAEGLGEETRMPAFQQDDKARSSNLDIALGDLPDAVRAVVDQVLAGSHITRVRRKLRDGRTVYEIDADVGLNRVEWDLYEDGTLRKMFATLEPERLPIPVLATAVDVLGSIPPDSRATRFEEGSGARYYNLRGIDGQIRYNLWIAANGILLARAVEKP